MKELLFGLFGVMSSVSALHKGLYFTPVLTRSPKKNPISNMGKTRNPKRTVQFVSCQLFLHGCYIINLLN